ncbi:hypothetical protein KM043_003787 [Ampulex compressa]|nr:hypothetical protein KM043_003787 [Ampulex compressa]
MYGNLGEDLGYLLNSRIMLLCRSSCIQTHLGDSRGGGSPLEDSRSKPNTDEERPFTEYRPSRSNTSRLTEQEGIVVANLLSETRYKATRPLYRADLLPRKHGGLNAASAFRSAFLFVSRCTNIPVRPLLICPRSNVVFVLAGNGNPNSVIRGLGDSTPRMIPPWCRWRSGINREKNPRNESEGRTRWIGLSPERA